ncbi:non-reducing end alpha-L-arabinofuranosidase family hydrolase [Actinacidiphila epipremni]|uniref:non-reducing end alpha-L-arabinofuranosidase n=1 Tax=Actinacidiphila epipremni TaxID=2053013 RepID=A0ABX0ZXN5_9ACTN|nr:non-reducing end alpha-L-arabinofuranosidase family hydrolase [Actinacidiphila epipremni]NJP46351.1 hypothetical protein [Actinacidiphila epipremni]
MGGRRDAESRRFAGRANSGASWADDTRHGDLVRDNHGPTAGVEAR